MDYEIVEIDFQAGTVTRTPCTYLDGLTFIAKTRRSRQRGSPVIHGLRRKE